MSLSIAEKKRFRQIGHQLNPVVLLGGQGLTEAVLAEIDRAFCDVYCGISFRVSTSKVVRDGSESPPSAERYLPTQQQLRLWPC